MIGCLDSISQSDEGDHLNFSEGDDVLGDGHKSAYVVPVLVNEEESTFVPDVGDVAELGVGEVVPILVPDVLVNFH